MASAAPPPADDEALILEVGRLYRLHLVRVRHDLPMAGSPERCAYRAVAADGAGGLFVVERLLPNARAHKTHIADALVYLRQHSLAPVHPYLADGTGTHVLGYRGAYWQIMPYIAGVPLPRPGWVHDAWRGTALAEFLLGLRRASQTLPWAEAEPFSIAGYIQAFMETAAAHNPELLPDLDPVVVHLRQAFFPIHDRLPRTFCHGDYHPLNVIWRPGEMAAVIDWEFAGHKPELYDVATLLGCAGIEDPAALDGPLAQALVGRLCAASDYASAESWRSLPELTLAVRFGWLAEWLRKRDAEMIELELDYMHLLLDRVEALRTIWHAA